MIIGLITSLVLVLFMGGGQNSFFLNPDVKKDIKIYVLDKERQKEIYSIIDVMEKDQKAFLKEKHKYYEKEAASLNKDYNAKRSDFDTLFLKYSEDRKVIQLNSWSNETKIRALITEEEWDAMMANLLTQPDSNQVEDGLTTVSEKMFNNLKQACEKNISDSTALVNALTAIDNQKFLINQMLAEYLNLDYYHVEKLRKKNASLEDFNEVTQNINKLRYSIIKHFFDMRFDLIKDVTPKEWNKLSKEFTKTFIQGKGKK